jgi:hypothetical protein
MVLPEVVKRLMMMSGAGSSTFTAECGLAATSRLTEVTATTVPAGTSPARRTEPENVSMRQAGMAWPQSNEVPSTQMQ